MGLRSLYETMMKRRIVLTVGCLLLCAAAVGTWKASRSDDPLLSLGIVDQGTNQAGQRSVTLLLTKVGASRICYPDGFEVQARGARMPVYVPTEWLWLEPGEEAEIRVALPPMTTNWCGLVHYYRESPWNRVKMRLGAASFAGRLPSDLTSVGGQVVKRPWMGK